jgi:hydrogenase-4 component F
MKLGFIMILLGYGAKAGIAPMHTWKPDAYSQAPIPAAALLAAGVLKCALYGIARFYVLAVKCLGPSFPGGLLIFFGLASMLVAMPFILAQRNYRRLLAYSSIEHTGIIVTAMGFGGPLGMLGSMLHMLFHAVTKPLLFFCAGNIQQQFGTPFSRKIRGVIHVMPVTGILLTLVTLAVVAVPPFSMFQSEFLILSAGVASHPVASGVFIFCVVAIFAGFLQHIVRLNFGRPVEERARPPLCVWKTGVMAALGLCIFLLGLVLPAPLFRLAQAAAQVIGGGQ